MLPRRITDLTGDPLPISAIATAGRVVLGLAPVTAWASRSRTNRQLHLTWTTMMGTNFAHRPRLLHVPRLSPLLCALCISYTHLRAHETPEHLVCRLLLEKK